MVEERTSADCSGTEQFKAKQSLGPSTHTHARTHTHTHTHTTVLIKDGERRSRFTNPILITKAPLFTAASLPYSPQASAVCGWSRLASVRQTMPKVSVNFECSRQTMQQQQKKKTQRNQHFSSGCSRLASVRANHAQNHLFQFWVFSACQCPGKPCPKPHLPFPGVLGLPNCQANHAHKKQTKPKKQTKNTSAGGVLGLPVSCPANDVNHHHQL